MGKRHLAGFVGMWCSIMRHAPRDAELLRAYQGLYSMLRANPQPGLQCFPLLAEAIASLFPAPPPVVEASREMLQSYKQLIGAQWPAVHGQLSMECRNRLKSVYGIE